MFAYKLYILFGVQKLVGGDPNVASKQLDFEIQCHIDNSLKMIPPQFPCDQVKFLTNWSALMLDLTWELGFCWLGADNIPCLNQTDE